MLGSSMLCAQADTTVDETEFLRQQEREQALREQHETTPDVRIPRPTAEDDLRIPVEESPCFNIQLIQLNGEESERFQWALKQAYRTPQQDTDLALPHCLGATGINLVMRRIQNAIIARGYVTTRILAQPQDLKSGQLLLTVIPGRVHDIRMDDATKTKAGFRHALPLRKGALLNLRDIEQALENFRRVPTVTADIKIVPAEGKFVHPGDSDIVVNWQQTTPLRVSLSADDAGSDTTGKYQGNLTVSADNWLSINDLFYVNLLQDLGGGDEGERGNEGHTVHYSFPLSYWSFAITDSEYEYRQAVAGANETYVYSGESNNRELELERLLYRNAVRKFSVMAGAWERSSRNYIDDTEVEVQRRRMAGWSLGISHIEFWGPSTEEFSLNYRRGTGAQNALPAPEENFDEGTSRPEIFILNSRFTLPFTIKNQSLRFISNWRAQWNHTPLVPQDNFSIGGRYTVRGFDGERVLAADRGWLLRNDLGWQPGNWGQELYLGVDYGQIGGADADRNLGTRLSGAALGLRGKYRWLSYDIFTGIPLQQPDGFVTADYASGFQLSLTF